MSSSSNQTWIYEFGDVQWQDIKHLHSQTRTTKQNEINTNIVIQNTNQTRFVLLKLGPPHQPYVSVQEDMSDHSVVHSSWVSFNHCHQSTKLDLFPCGGEIGPSQTCHGTPQAWLLVGASQPSRSQDPKVANVSRTIYEAHNCSRIWLALYFEIHSTHHLYFSRIAQSHKEMVYAVFTRILVLLWMLGSSSKPSE